ncbi:MAG: zinc-ribbon domain-containing protein [Pikeienuella sp.]
MRLVCPSCAAEYEIAADAIGEGGRRVRCSSCASEWFQQPASSSVEAASAAMEAAVARAAQERAARRAGAAAPEPEAEAAPPEAETAAGAAEAIPPQEAPRQPEAPHVDDDAPKDVARVAPDDLAASLRGEAEAEAQPNVLRAFISGFATVMAVALVLIALYAKHVEIAAFIPWVEGPLSAYASLVEQGRAALYGFFHG